jgi:prolyl 4-hydroxylase
MYVDKHGPKWAEWIRHNIERGCDIMQMKESMVSSVWSEVDAINALNYARGLPTFDSARPDIPNHNLHNVDGHTVRTLCRIVSPNAVLLDNLITEEEAEELLSLAKSKGLRPSSVVDSVNGGSIMHDARTSSGVFFSGEIHPILTKISNRISKLTNWPEDKAEVIQVLCYEKSQEYKPHFDWFDPNFKGSASHLVNGGQRVGTTVIYLQLSEDGGRTSFPEAGVEMSPNVGGAIFFSDVDENGVPDRKTLHAGTPVLDGVKIVATFWQRENTVNK